MITDNKKAIGTKVSCVIPLVILLFSEACSSGTRHSYIIEFNEAPNSIETLVCDRSSSGSIDADRARGSFDVDCEGPVSITLKYDDHQTRCQIGYVTYAEAPKLWTFRIIERACVPA